jgi:hypothetical protein
LSEYSPKFKFHFAEVKKRYKFYLVIKSKGKKEKDDIGIYFISKNNEKLEMKFSICLLNNSGSRFSECSQSETFLPKYNWGFANVITRSELVANSETFLPNGNLEIECNFTIFQSTPDCFKIKPIRSDPDTCQQSMERLCLNPDFSDLQIVCGGQTFPCHKNILANKSDVLEKMLKSESWSENEDNVLSIKDFKPNVVAQMIHFIYTSQLPLNATCSTR